MQLPIRDGVEDAVEAIDGVVAAHVVLVEDSVQAIDDDAVVAHVVEDSVAPVDTVVDGTGGDFASFPDAQGHSALVDDSLGDLATLPVSPPVVPPPSPDEPEQASPQLQRTVSPGGRRWCGRALL